MKANETALTPGWLPPAVEEEVAGYDRHAYLRPWRYFRFFVLYEPMSNRSCWLPEGYDL